MACIKGVIADEMRFESGWEREPRWAFEAACERVHVQCATRVMATSKYSSEKITEHDVPPQPPLIVPEIGSIWKDGAGSPPGTLPRSSDGKFVVLSVCRFYPRKRLQVLLDAAERLSGKIPRL